MGLDLTVTPDSLKRSSHVWTHSIPEDMSHLKCSRQTVLVVGFSNNTSCVIYTRS